MVQEQQNEPFYGIGLDVDSDFNKADVGEAAQFDADVTIVGVTNDEGGEQRESEDGGKPWTTPPQIILTGRVDQCYSDPDRDDRPVPIFVSLSRGKGGGLVINKDGKAAYFVNSLGAHGISLDESNANVYQLKGWGDIYGLKFRLQYGQIPNPVRRGQRIRIETVAEVYGFDNVLRKEQGLDAVGD